jgi:hypothetical protein
MVFETYAQEQRFLNGISDNSNESTFAILEAVPMGMPIRPRRLCNKLDDIEMMRLFYGTFHGAEGWLEFNHEIVTSKIPDGTVCYPTVKVLEQVF